MKRYFLLLSIILFLPILLSAALAMESSIFEDPEFMQSPFRANALQPRTKPFERLEFLGDRVLNLVTAHMLYKAPYFRDGDVGDLAASHAFLVSKYILVDMYKDLHIDSSKLSSPSYCAPENGYIAEKTASDIVEALMGALYMERGFEKAQEPLEQFVEKYWSLKSEKPIKSIQKMPVSSVSLRQLCFAYSSKNFDPMQEALEYQFKNERLLREAFRHSSMGGELYKKLGFLGVRVLGLVLADYVFNKEQEDGAGTLSQNFDRVIGNKSLEQIFQKWRLGKYLDRQFGGTGISTGMAADTIRTLVSAVYLDGGWKPAYTVVHKLFFSDPPPQFLEADLYAFADSYDEIKEEDFGGFSSEERLELPGAFDLEEKIDPNNPKEQWPTCTNNEQIISKKNSVWDKINNSSVKASMENSKNSRTLPQSSIEQIDQKTPAPHQSALAHRLSLRNVKTNKTTITQSTIQAGNIQNSRQLLTNKKEETMPTPQREMWPALVQMDQPTKSKDSMWNNTNSAITKSAIQTEKVQNPQQLPMDKNERAMPNPQREMWPTLSPSTQAIGKK